MMVCNRQRGLQFLLLAWIGVGSLTPLASQVAGGQRKKLVILIAGQSYETDRTLPAFATQFLSEQFRTVTVTGAMTNPGHRFDRIEELADADLLLVSVWRRAPPKEQLALVRRHVDAGKPVVGIGTASHAFARGR